MEFSIHADDQETVGLIRAKLRLSFELPPMTERSDVEPGGPLWFLVLTMPSTSPEREDLLTEALDAVYAAARARGVQVFYEMDHQDGKAGVQGSTRDPRPTLEHLLRRQH